MTYIIRHFFTPLLLLLQLFISSIEIAQAGTGAASGLSEEKLASIEDIVEKAIRAGQIPGAVVLIGNQDKVVYRRAFGHRALVPDKLP